MRSARASQLGRDYLIRGFHDGRFTYRINLMGLVGHRKYNILWHARALYALQDVERRKPSPGCSVLFTDVSPPT